jgi:SAM-dependent methyltransferase
MNSKEKKFQKQQARGWDNLCDWYDGWMGQHGSQHHRDLAIPHLLNLLEPHRQEQILDVGAGQGVLAPYIYPSGACYTGIDISNRMIQRARQRHGRSGQFLAVDVRKLQSTGSFKPAQFDAVVFLLSIQDMEPLETVLEAAAWTLKAGGRLVILMTHPCFRLPRQSGWGFDPKRKLLFRRIDRYLSPLRIPVKCYPGKQRGVSITFHRPLMSYINLLGENGLLVSQMVEISSGALEQTKMQDKTRKRAEAEIPLFLGIKAYKLKG